MKEILTGSVVAQTATTRSVQERLRDVCVGHPDAQLPWPHRILHDAATELDKSTAEVATLRERNAALEAALRDISNDVWRWRETGKPDLSALTISCNAARALLAKEG